MKDDDDDLKATLVAPPRGDIDPVASGQMVRSSPLHKAAAPPHSKRTQAALPEPISLSSPHIAEHHEPAVKEVDYDDIPEPAMSVRDPLPSFPIDPPPSSSELRGAAASPTPPSVREHRDPRTPRPARRTTRARGTLASQIRQERSLAPPPEPLLDDDKPAEEEPDEETPHSRNLTAIVIFACVLVAGLGGYALGLTQGRNEAIAKRRAEAPPATSHAAAPTAGSTMAQAPAPSATETATASAEPTASAAPTSSAAVAEAPSANASASASAAPAPSAPLAPASPVEVRPPTPEPTPTETASAAPRPPSAGIDKGEMGSAMSRSAAAAMSGCPSDTDGSLSVTVTFLPSGSVGSVSSSGSLAGTNTAACVERLFGVAHVSPFVGDPVTATGTVTLRARQ